MRMRIKITLNKFYKKGERSRAWRCAPTREKENSNRLSNLPDSSAPANIHLIFFYFYFHWKSILENLSFFLFLRGKKKVVRE